MDSNRAPEEGELDDVLDELGRQPGKTEASRPNAVTIEQISEAAQKWTTFHDWISDRKNRRQIPHKLEACGYVAVRNPTREQGLWVVGGKRSVIYAKRSLSLKDQIAAATKLKNDADKKAGFTENEFEKEAVRLEAEAAHKQRKGK